jgi:hypothetical protein
MSSNADQLLFVFNRIARASAHEWPHIFEDLRRRKRLSETIRHLNRLLKEPAHRELAETALRRLGLHQAG